MYFDDFILFPGWPGLPEQKTDDDRIRAFLHDVRAKAFDIVFQMQGNGEVTNKMCLLWNARIVTGLRRAGEFAANNEFFPESEDDESEVLRFMKLLPALNISARGTDLEFPILPEESMAFDEIKHSLALESGRYICLHPGARDPRRRWPARNFSAVGSHFANLQYQVVLTGSAEESDLLNEVEHGIQGPVINVVKTLGHIPLGQLACMIRDSMLLISNDTGVSHIASGLGKASVIIFSPYSNIDRWAPLNTKTHRVIAPHDAQPSYVIRVAGEQLELSEPTMKNRLS